MTRRTLRSASLPTLFFCFTVAATVPRVAGGSTGTAQVASAPPEIRALVEAVVTAANGAPAQWEAMAKARFSAEYLASQTPDERARLHQQMKKKFGILTRDRVMRRGPDAPLELNVKGSTGAAGTILLIIEEAPPYRITSIELESGAAGTPRGDTPFQVPIAATMTTDELTDALDSYLSTLAADDVLSGVALVANSGRVVFERGYGFADRAHRVANTPATRFNIGSINKTFTQIAIAQLVAAGKLGYADTLGTFFPDHPQPESRPATIQQLLNHTAGLADFFGEEFARMSKDAFRSNADYFRLVSRLPPLFPPGTRKQYCNGCYVALGAIIERVSGVPYERYVHDKVFVPAGMSSTGYPHSDAIEPNVALGYTRRGSDNRIFRSNVFLHGAAGSAAGGGYATARDLLAYVNALRDGRLGAAADNPAAGNLGVAGGAPGTSAVLESHGTWTVVVLTNLDPPAGENIGIGLMRALTRGE